MGQDLISNTTFTLSLDVDEESVSNFGSASERSPSHVDGSKYVLRETEYTT